MKDYSSYTAIEFAADTYFIEWVKIPSASNTLFWEKYQLDNPLQKEEIAIAKQLIIGWQVAPSGVALSAMDEVWQKIQDEITPVEQSPVWAFRPWYKNVVVKYAAMLAIIGISVVAYFLISKQWQTTQIVTGDTETKNITLPDGSKVVLNANSSITFSQDWQPNTPREIILSGEAFFSITHQKNHQQFIVNTPNHLQVEVLGTEFTVSEQAQKTRIVLNKGKIKLHVDNVDTRSLVMKPGELVEVSKNPQEKIIRRTVTPEVYSTWKDNLFMFEDTSLEEVASIIERNFSYKVKFKADSLKELRITIRLPKRDLDLLLMAISEIHDLKIDKGKKQIILAQNTTHK